MPILNHCTDHDMEQLKNSGKLANDKQLSTIHLSHVLLF